jgi:hypothetical protein
MIPLSKGKNSINYGVIRSKVKVTVAMNIIFDNRVVSTFDLMTPKLIVFFPFQNGIMWPSLVNIRYTELKKVKVTVTINKIVDNKLVST